MTTYSLTVIPYNASKQLYLSQRWSSSVFWTSYTYNNHHRSPICGKKLLASTFVNYLTANSWVNQEIKIYFCTQFLIRIFDHLLWREKSSVQTNKLNGKDLHSGLSMLKSYPKEGSELLVGVLMFELLNRQEYSASDLILFYDYIFYGLFC
jgi:hypothetical protein